MSSGDRSTAGQGKSGKGDDRGTVKKEKFEGRTSELSGYTFDITNARQSNQYSRTVKEVARYVGSKYTSGADVKRTIEAERLFTVPRPTRPTALGTGATAEQQENFEIETDIYREGIKNFV